MKIDILTLFPEMFAPLKMSILGRAQAAGLVEIVATDIRDFSRDKHKKCDDYPFGGGKGLVMTPQPAADAIRAVDPEHRCRRIYLSPRGPVLNQRKVRELAGCERLLLFCGHYEGLDQRVIDGWIDEELSVGDYVLTGGEIAAMAVADSVCRCLTGVLAEGAADEESFSDDLLEYPQYTRPEVFEGREVPAVLLTGHHANIEEWRMAQRVALTEARRPDLLAKSVGAATFLREQEQKRLRRERREREKQRRRQRQEC